ncbi:MAG: heparan-alpha-glucosaminide N-acetyltransferase domain-containing protein [Promethearchaeota archaeon]
MDALRGFGVVLVILSHCSHYWSGDIDNIFFYMVNVLVPIGAPIFMLLVGMSTIFMVEAKKSKGQSDIEIRNYVLKRGLFLICFGFIYNAIAEASIYYLSPNYNFNVNSAVYAIYNGSTFIDWLFLFGIFHIIGVGLVTSNFSLRFSKKSRIKIAIGILIMNLIVTYSPLLVGGLPYRTFQLNWHYSPTAHPLSILLDILFYGQYPLIPWLFYFVFGTVIGEILLENVKKNEPNKFIEENKITFVILTLMGAVMLLFLFIPDYFPESTLFVLHVTGASLLLYSAFYIFYERNHSQSKMMEIVLVKMGRFSLSIYFLTGILIVDLFLIIGIVIQIPLLGNMSFFAAFLMTLIYLGFFIALTYFWEKYNFKYSLNWIEKKIIS